MPVARDHLCADRLGLQPQFLADMRLDRRVDVGEGADSAGNRAGCDFFACNFKTFTVALHLGIEPGEGQAHRRRLRVDAVAATYADGILVLKRAALERVEQAVHVCKKDVGGAHQLHVEGRVQNVRAGHALVHEPGFRVADDLGQVGEEGDDVVLRLALDLVDPVNVELDVLGLPDRLGGFFRDHPQIRLRIAGMGLDLVPDAELGLGRPDGDHVGAGIARDHRRAFRRGRAL